MAESKIIPYAMLFCEQVLSDEAQKRSLIGLFDRVQGPSFPMALARMVVFIGLHGEIPENGLSLRVGEDSGTEPFTELPLPVANKPANGKLEILVQAHGIPFAKPGRYRFELMFDGRPLLARCIDVVEIAEAAQSFKNVHA